MVWKVQCHVVKCHITWGYHVPCRGCNYCKRNVVSPLVLYQSFVTQGERCRALTFSIDPTMHWKCRQDSDFLMLVITVPLGDKGQRAELYIYIYICIYIYGRAPHSAGLLAGLWCIKNPRGGGRVWLQMTCAFYEGLCAMKVLNEYLPPSGFEWIGDCAWKLWSCLLSRARCGLMFFCFNCHLSSLSLSSTFLSGDCNRMYHFGVNLTTVGKMI